MARAGETFQSTQQTRCPVVRGEGKEGEGEGERQRVSISLGSNEKSLSSTRTLGTFGQLHLQQHLHAFSLPLRESLSVCVCKGYACGRGICNKSNALEFSEKHKSNRAVPLLLLLLLVK